MQSRRTWLASASAAAAFAQSDRASRLKQYLAGRAKPVRLPFDWKAPQPLRATARPRLLVAPGEEWRLRAEAIPAALWRPRPQQRYEAPEPNPKGNGGAPGYVLLELAAAWLATGEDTYLDTAIRTLRRVAEYPHWGREGKRKDTDLDAGALLFAAGVAYDTFHARLSPEDRDAIRAKLVRQSRLMYSYHRARPSVQWEQNHIYIDLGGLWCAAAALHGEEPEAREWYELGTRALKTAVHLLDNPDGAFYEGVSYWNFGFALHLLPFLELFRNATGADAFAAFESLAKQKLYLMHVLLPGGRYWLNLGDAGHSAAAAAGLGRARYAMLKYGAEYRDPEAQFLAGYFAEAGRLEPASDPWTLLFWDPGVETRDPRPNWSPAHHFEDLGLVTLRSGWNDTATHFALRCGPALGHRATSILLGGEIADWKPSTGHVHPDLNSPLIFDHGEHMVVDTGYTWLKRTRDHSTLVIDGAGQIGDGARWPNYEPWDRFGRIGAFLAAPGGYAYTRGEAAQGYLASLELLRFDRHAVMMPDADASYFLFHDRIECAAERRLEWLLLTLERAAQVGENEWRMESGKRALTIRLLEPVGLAAAVERTVVTHRETEGAVPERGYRLILTPREPVRKLEILALLALHDAASSAPPLTLAEGGIRIEGARWSDRLSTRGAGAGIDTDGHHAAVRSRGGQLAGWGFHDGTRLVSAGRQLCSASSNISAAATIEKGRTRISFVLDRPADAAFHAGSRPVEINCNGKTESLRFDPDARMLRFHIAAGRYELSYL